MMFTEQNMPVTGGVMTKVLSVTAAIQGMPTIGEAIMIAGDLITVLIMVTEDTDVLNFMAMAAVVITTVAADMRTTVVADMRITVAADMKTTVVVDMAAAVADTAVADMAADTADINHYNLILTGFPKTEACFRLGAYDNN
jgi:hypothetical protein